MAETVDGERTTVEIKRDLHRRLKEIRPYDSMSFHELIEDMADQYETPTASGGVK